MKTKSFATTAGLTVLAFAMWITLGLLQGQGPMYDRINVNLPYTVTVADKTLQPGDYTIQQLPSTGGSSRVLLIYSDSGMKFETSAMTIPALDINTPRETQLVLNHVGDDYYINKIWVQGKDYGYELPIPDNMKSRQNEKVAETTVPARSQSTSESETVKVDVNSTSEKAQNTTPANSAVTTETTAQNAEPVAQPVTEPAAQPVTEAAAQPVTQPAEQPVAQPSTPVSADNSADRAATDEQTPSTPAPAEMPKTAAGWLTMLLSGRALSGAGMMLRRKR